MTKHYIGATKKRRNSGKVSRGLTAISETLPTWKAFASGMLSGATLACIGFYLLSTPEITLKIPATSVSNAPTVETKTTASNKSKAPPAVTTISEKPTAKEPRFDFYTELTKGSHETNQTAATSTKTQTLDLKTPVKPINKYFVQAGAFKNRSDADALKAKITLNGMDAKIEIAKLDDGNIWHRVVLGPFKSESIAAEQKQALKNLDVDGPLVLKHTDH